MWILYKQGFNRDTTLCKALNVTDGFKIQFGVKIFFS